MVEKLEYLPSWQKFLKFHSTVISEIETQLKKEGAIPLAWYDILIELKFAPDYRLRQKELARACILTKSGISKTLSTLEKNNLIKRVADKSDGRSVFALLTKKGSNELKMAWPIYKRCIEEFYYLSSTEYQSMENIFNKLLSKFSRKK